MRCGRNHALGQSEATLFFAETTLIQVERPFIDADGSCSTSPCALWSSSSNLNPLTATDTWWQTQANSPSFDANSYYTIEDVGFIADTLNPEDLASGIGIGYYRITSRSVAPGNTEVITQSIFAQRY